MKKPKDDRESLRALVRELYDWAATMGGWESPVWDKVDALVNAWDAEPEPDKPYADSFSGPVTAFHRSLGRAMVCEPIPDDYPVRPLDVDEPAAIAAMRRLRVVAGKVAGLLSEGKPVPDTLLNEHGCAEAAADAALAKTV